VRRGIEVVVDSSPAVLPPFSPDLETEPPEAVRRFRQACGRSEAILLAAPEYAFGIPGAFKNALDWTVGSGSLCRKPVALPRVAARGHGAHLTQALDDVFTALDGDVTHHAVLVALADRGADGEIRQPHLVEALQIVVVELQERARSRSADTQVPLRASREGGCRGHRGVVDEHVDPASP
jgi:NAD(P)H-dependent FMN reductase